MGRQTEWDLECCGVEGERGTKAVSIGFSPSTLPEACSEKLKTMGEAI